MNWTMTKMEFNGNYAQIRSTDMNELLVQGGKCSYKSTKQSTSAILIATVFFLPPPSPWRVSFIIKLPLDHLDPTLVGHLSSYLLSHQTPSLALYEF